MNKFFRGIRAIKYLAIVLCLSFGHVSAIYARPLCSSVFSDIPWGNLRPDFKHNTNYTKEIPQETGVKNQCNLGTCHQHSWLTNLEQQYAQQTGQVIALSNPYQSAQQLLHRSLNMLGLSQNSAKVSLGASPMPSREEILSYGLVPESVWTPKTEFYRDPTAKKINEYLENIIARTKWQANKAESPKQKEALMQQGAAQIKELLRGFIGELPTHFEYQGKYYTPEQFATAYFGFFKLPQTQMIVNISRRDPESMTQANDKTTIRTSIDSVEQKTAELIDQGKMVYLAYEHHAEYVDKSTGVMSIRAFYTPDYAKPLNREQREVFGKNTGGHAVQIIGYERSPFTSEIVKWKIKNSWGEKSGDSGYYHMYNDYFRAFTKSVAYATEGLPTIPLKMPVKGQ